MDWLHQTNFAFSNLAAQLLIGGTSLSITAGEGDRFPHAAAADHFQLVIWGAAHDTPVADAARELVHAHYNSADTYDITRAQEGTTAKQWEIGDKCALVLSAAYLADIETEIDLKKADSVSASDKLLGRVTTGAGAIEEIACTEAARSILDDATVAAILTTLDAMGYAHPRVKVVATTHDISVTGAQQITGAGFTPVGALILSIVGGTAVTCVGIGTAGAERPMYSNYGGTPSFWAGGDKIITLQVDATKYAFATIASFDADGITLTWTKNSTPTGTADVYCLLFR